LSATIDGVLASIGRPESRRRPQDAALDGTGMKCTSASTLFVSGALCKRTKFVKLMLGVLCTAVMPVVLVVDLGPSHDMKQRCTLREKMKETCKPTMLWGDRVFDSERWHKANW
jgi:hypothetical protein